MLRAMQPLGCMHPTVLVGVSSDKFTVLFSLSVSPDAFQHRYLLHLQIGSLRTPPPPAPVRSALLPSKLHRSTRSVLPPASQIQRPPAPALPTAWDVPTCPRLIGRCRPPGIALHPSTLQCEMQPVGLKIGYEGSRRTTHASRPQRPISQPHLPPRSATAQRATVEAWRLAFDIPPRIARASA